mmetsp:Transcript_27534/g.65470  ORF Transcript_27534/g.65470 Transcript_27534/m.65470 type:complete len:87 (-) Transcript_27534:145-405(-)
MTPTIINMTIKGTPKLMADSTELVIDPTANPSETEETVIRQKVPARVRRLDLSPVRYFSIAANVSEKKESKGISATTFARTYSSGE